ncbi:tetratricopeptide repeat protein [Methylosinus sp. H3A]|uniref:tetratricopeptide repeat protein n=1 Tax=Methylosinus sp. H3A TaxID=2785786 RepID=UPI0018C21075|nr:tetratricopeptide repeat protein [Methylosinus sp. H3A]MBG0808149.1 tetratricopeptide repeat protein [Methylosinus sp. H3A]
MDSTRNERGSINAIIEIAGNRRNRTVVILHPETCLSWSSTIAISVEGIADEKIAVAEMSTPIPRLSDKATEQALAALDRGDTRDALDKLTKAITFDACNAYAYATRGFLHFDLGDRDRGFADLASAIEAAPENAAWYAFRAILYRRIDDLPRAIADLDKVLEIDPDDKVAVLERGTCLHWLNKRDAAIADFTRALTLDPGSDEAYYMRGRTWFQKARYPDAIADFTECLRIAPTRVDAYVARGETFVSRANRPNNKPAKRLLYLNSAIADLDRAISLAPRNSDAYRWRARAHRSVERFDASIADFTKSLSLCSEAETQDLYVDRAETYYARWMQSRREEDFDLAIADLSVAVARDHDCGYWHDLLVGYHMDRGCLRYGASQYHAAIADFSKAIELGGNADPHLVAQSFVRRGGAYLSAGLLGLAIADFTEALAREPGDVEARRHRGRAWRAKGDHIRAIADFTAVIEQRPADLDAYRLRALARWAIGERDAAALDLAEGINVADRAPFETDRKRRDIAQAHVLMFAGRTDEARQLYLKWRGELGSEDIGSLVFLAPTWEQTIREEFNEFCEVGIHHPLMDEIAAIFLGPAS